MRAVEKSLLSGCEVSGELVYVKKAIMMTGFNIKRFQIDFMECSRWMTGWSKQLYLAYIELMVIVFLRFVHEMDGYLV